MCRRSIAGYRANMARPTLSAALALGLLVGCAPVADAPGRSDARLERADSIVASWVAAGAVTGAVLLVSRNDEVVLQSAHGSARAFEYDRGEYGASAAGESAAAALTRLAEPTPMTTSTVFDLASVTKVMATTMAMMLLVDGGDIDIDEPVASYLPDFRGAGKEGITPRHLLTHRSGLAQWLPVYYDATSPDEAYAFIRDRPLSWPVGEGRHYSDLGFMLLGRLVDRVSGVSLDAFVRDELYSPMGLTSTGFRPLGQPRGLGTFAATSHGNPYEHRMVHDPDFGYRIEGDPDRWSGWREYTLAGEVNDGNAFHAWDGVAGHAGLFSTAGELRVLIQLLLNGGEHGGRRYVDGDVIDVFLTSTGEGQALGWQVPANAPEGSFTHTGFTGTFVFGAPSTGLAVVLLTNRQNGGVDAEGAYPDVAPLQRAVVAALTNEGGGPAR
jgi:CubicO group peptidase (beta-lactamase class C family)